MADEDAFHDPEIDVPEPDLAWIADELAGLDHLRPDAAFPANDDLPAGAEPMPAWVWVRMQGALAAERAAAAPAAASATDAEVIDLASRMPGERGQESPHKHSRATRWAGGLVAASVAVLAVGVGVTAFRGGGSGGGEAVVAGEIVQASAMSAPNDARAFAASPAPLAGGDAAASTGAEAAPLTAQDLSTPKLTFAGMVPPTLRLLGSDTDYTAKGLRAQVSTVLDRVGLAPEQAQAAMEQQAPETVVMPEVDPAGFLSSAQALRDCITKLTKEAESTALMVDMSTYQGEQAGVVVAPEYSDTAADPAPDLSVLEVWIVDPQCLHPQKMLTMPVEP